METKGTSGGFAGAHRFSHQAMATIFEILIADSEQLYAAQAARAAFEELDRLERELSRYIPSSDIARLNNHPPKKPLQLGLDAFECLTLSARLSAETKGAFDVTIGNLLECWRKGIPTGEELDRARKQTGMHLVKLNAAHHTVELLAHPLRIDLGGMGKGYAVDRMGELLREWDIPRALIHGGRSSVLALDGPLETEGWPVTLDHPGERTSIIARALLKNSALGGSGLKKKSHIIDPRTGRSARGKLAAWAGASTAAVADALSTAFMVLTPGEIDAYLKRQPEVLAAYVTQEGKTVIRRGPECGIQLRLPEN